MKQFDARVTYYVHDFITIQNWFGNRGIPIIDGDLREWCYDGEYLYYQCNPSAPTDMQGDDIEDVIMCVLNSMYFEPYEFMDYSKSPFANKLL